MKLPEFNEADVRGVGGTPPELWHTLGLQQPADDSRQTQGQDQGQTPPAGAQDAPPQAPPEEPRPLDERLRAIQQKYGDDPFKLAEAYANSEQARSRAQAEGMVRENELLQRIEWLEQQRARELAERQYQQWPQHPQQSQPEYAPDEPLTRAAAEALMQQHVSAAIAAVEERRRAERINHLRASNASEIEQLKPLMNRIWAEDQALYANVPADQVAEHLLKRAREQQQVILANQFYKDVQGLQPGQAEPEPRGGALPSGGSGSRTYGSPAPTGNWSSTKAFKNFLNTRSDSQDELLALSEALKERGFGEHLK